MPLPWPRMRHLLPIVSALLLALSLPAAAQKQTVCTITVNSSDEKETFRRHLPDSDYRFVELVERGRPDWLSSSCRSAVACDALIISAHYDGGNEFFSDRLDVAEFLTVTELERVSCSDSCPSLFSKLKEVYLFGCNTLNPSPQTGASAEVVRGLVREGHSTHEAERELQSLNAAHGESSRDRMRQVFNDVPVIYGFSSTAPLGPIAGNVLERYFRAAGNGEIAHGRPSSRLLDYFARFSMAVTRGMTERDPYVEARADMCMFADERLTPATKLLFVHQILQRSTVEARLHLDRIQRLVASLDRQARAAPAVAQALEEIGRDDGSRTRFLDYARQVDRPSVRVRLLDVAHDVGWLTEGEQRDEIARMLRETLERREIGIPEVNLACGLNQRGALSGAVDSAPASTVPDDAAHAAVRACLGSASDRARLLQALVGDDEADVRVAQAYLRHRPIAAAAELRRVAASIARMASGAAQARALEALARHYVADHEVLSTLLQLYADTPSPEIQSAIAGILMRADRRSIAEPQLVRVLVEHRRSADADDDSTIDGLLRILRLP